jgi:hypothetical protein
MSSEVIAGVDIVKNELRSFSIVGDKIGGLSI